ncbi:tetratricopeptide repeat protein [Streptomyces sp. NPDC015242]|uniref:tetratricopeptide repeat protein n=1 Tax=Streptomyces sp. NPDC015242 TaxID=3364951 RepID=UPI0036FD05D6
MSRLSREKKREQKQAARAATPAAPIDVHVPGAGTETGTGANGASEGASVGGVPVFAAPGEEIQQAVLGRLHHIALATGHSVLATVHDERIGYVVPLRVDPDGSSHFTAEPMRTPPAAPESRTPSGPAPTPPSGPVHSPPAGPVRAASSEPSPVPPGEPAPMPPAGPVHASAPVEPGRPAAAGPASPAASGPAHASTAEPVSPPPHRAGPERSGSDRATHVLRPAAETGHGTTPTFPLRAVPEPQTGDEPVPTFELRAVQEPAPRDTPPPAATPPGTVAPPTGAFGPPPAMDARPLPGPGADHPSVDVRPGPEPGAGHPPMDARPLPLPGAGHPHPARGAGSGSRTGPVPEAALLAADPDPKPTPARGFDAVAEAVLGDEPPGAPGDPATPALLAEPVARINEAVKEGRIEAAAELADRTVEQASGTLGPEHPEVLRLRELTAYIAYLAGDPLRAFHLSLDLAGARRRAGDAEGAYGNVRSAATAWRAVRDPALGLELGSGLVGLWTELASEGGPAAEEIEELESARARMGRLTARARKQ